MKLDLTYRGALASCNYECQYCPFAKQHDDRQAREKDRQELKRFVAWVDSRKRADTIKILFTPWGEALVRRWYRESIITLSHFSHIEKVSIQTNLSAQLNWLDNCNKAKVALWTTYHPSEVSIEKFTQQSHKLVSMGVAHSVGIVGKREYADILLKLKEALHPSIYLWVNAYKDKANYYTQQDIDFFAKIDPHFLTNLKNHKSKGMPCYAGETALSIRGDGGVYPCHFVDRLLGNIYQDEIHQLLAPTLCPNTLCDCYIGYRHLKQLEQVKVYGDNVIARIPFNTS